MIDHRPLAEIGGMQSDWLKAKHHFALGRFGNPDHGPLGVLYVWNDDELAPRSGFPLHRHQDVEIVTYVRDGVITHEDSLGNRGQTRAGDVQVMSAGAGIEHSERNDEQVVARIFQIWLKPRKVGGTPRWGSKPFPRADRAGRLVPLASGRSLEEALPINADADVYGALLIAGGVLDIALAEGEAGYLVPAIGTVDVNGVRVGTSEGVALRDERSINVRAVTDAELVLVIVGPTE
jgi:redox-sensitive bicupin YhaK (pirin superfamily)